MIQEILVYMIVTAVILKIVYSLYKSLATKEKSLCGSCCSCGVKSELKKKNKAAYEGGSLYQRFPYKAESLNYSPEQ